MSRRSAWGLDTRQDHTDPWWEKAACKGANTDLFFPTNRNDSYSIARRYCQYCPVTEECLNDQLKYLQHQASDHGMWGGTTPDQRHHMLTCHDDTCTHPVHGDHRTTIHGTPCRARTHDNAHAYKEHGCRCPDAVHAYQQRSAAQRARAAARAGRPLRNQRLRLGYDPGKVDLARDGHPVELTEPEMLAAVAALTRLGYSIRRIAGLLRCSTRTVVRYRAKAATTRTRVRA